MAHGGLLEVLHVLGQVPEQLVVFANGVAAIPSFVTISKELVHRNVNASNWLVMLCSVEKFGFTILTKYGYG